MAIKLEENELDGFTDYLVDHDMGTDESCDMGGHYWCSCSSRTMYSFSEWMRFHVEAYRNEQGRISDSG